MPRWITASLAALGSIAGFAALAAYGHLAGWLIERVSPDALAEELRPGFEWVIPPGDGPFPTGIFFHGCGGLSDGVRAWAQELKSAGWAALILDSLEPRGITGAEVCGGRRLLGRERAGDVLIAIEEARHHPEFDPERLVLFGWSHGGWTLIETMAMNPPNELPPNLSAAPSRALEGVRGVVLFYPHCGVGARTGVWELEIPSLFLLAADDRQAPAAACVAMAKGLQDGGLSAEIHVYEGAGHGFDHTGRHQHRPEATAQARRALLDFLARHAERSGD